MKLRPVPPLSGSASLRQPLPAWIPADQLRALYERYRPAIAVSAVAVAVLLLFTLLYARHSRQVAVRSSALFRDALNLYAYRVPPPGSEVTPVVSSDEEKYAKAQTMFQQLHDTYPGSRLAPPALLYVGHCRFRLKQYHPALEAYDLFLARYRRHTLAPQATLGRADCLELLNRVPEAYDAYKSVMAGEGALVYEGSLGAVRCLIRLADTDRNRMSEAMDILTRLATGPTPYGARASRALRRLLTDLSAKSPAAGKPAPAP